MAVNEVTRSRRGAQPQPRKLDVYELLFGLNEGFERVLTDLRHLKRIGLWTDWLQGIHVTVEETRCWTNLDLVGAMQGREEKDWAHFGRLRRRWEKKYE